MVHPRTVYDRYGKGGQSLSWLRQNVDPCAERVPMASKHKYVLPFDRRLRRRLVEISMPYQKRLGSIDSDARPVPGTRGRCKSDPEAPGSDG